MISDFSRKTAVITGAGNGIGAALARRAAAEGMNVVLADIRIENAAAIAAELGDDRALAVATDVSDPVSVADLADKAWDRFGAVDLLCSNAGIVPGGRHRKIWEYGPGDWQWSIGVNLYGVVNGMRSFVPRMIAANRPAHILHTASVAGFVSGSGSGCYGASKHAVVRATEALYAGLKEVGAPIGVTMLCPGLVATGIYDAERNRPNAYLDSDGPPQESSSLQAMRDELYRNATTAEEAADIAFEAIAEGRFYAFTTKSFDGAIRQRADDILARANPLFEDIVAMSRRDAGLDDASLDRAHAK